MSSVIINETISINKKWTELLGYKIFVMKIIELGIATIAALVPGVVGRPDGHMYAMATGPTIVLSIVFIILYIMGTIPVFMEKLYLMIQSAMAFGSLMQIIVLNLSNLFCLLAFIPIFALLFAALLIDFAFNAHERGCDLSCA